MRLSWKVFHPKIAMEGGRVTFKIVLSYHGASFDGWQKQPGLSTVQRQEHLSLIADLRNEQIGFNLTNPFLALVLFSQCSIVEGSLGKFVDEKKTQLLKDKGLPVEGCAVVASCTDKGVTALQQVCSFCK
ncbi:hypothetical protein Ahy_A03g015586 [Arachis hypogaea]|uniref:Uncharacterized protein n=1 Tax=Arachis hypogaea TaxID=3818 RepID=A0A445E0Y4_ARAHY|nr:hypothetical protein Ahy_A03g015586 [Arachis hypogaea]